jgi:hemoglobin/transferrin/lactoferrin receptor protein
MKKLLLLIFLTFICFQVINSQTVTIVDQETLKPVSGALIYSDKKDKIKSDINGNADISNLKTSNIIYIEAIGYQTKVTSYTSIQSNNFNISLIEKSYSTDEIVVSSDRFSEKLKDVSNQIDIIDSKDIQNINAQNTGDLLSRTGNVFVQKSQQEGSSPVLRGFEASRILIIIDGVRLNNAIFRAGHLQNVLRIDQNILDRAEVFYGPGSLMYGSDALGGVLSFYTKNPVLSFNNDLYYNAGAYGRFSTSNNEKTGHFDFNLGFKNVGFLTSVTYSNFGDLRMGSNYDKTAPDSWKRRYYTERINGVDTMLLNDDYNVQKQSGYKQYDILQKILIKQSDNVFHTLNFQYSNTNDMVYRYDRLNTIGGSGKFSNAEWYYGPEQRILGSYNLNANATHTFFDNLQFVGAYQNIKESRNSRGFGSKNLTSRNEKVDVFTVNLDFKKRVNEHELRYGLEGAYNIVKSTAFKKDIVTLVETGASTRYPDGDNNMKSMAAYFSHSWEINPMFVLSDGVRFNYVTLTANFVDTTFYKFPFTTAEQKNAAITGHLGLVVMPSNDWRFYINSSTGFRAPNIDDLAKVFETTKGSSTSLGKVIVPNNDLKPEYTYNGELGISKIFANSIKVEGIIYATYFINAIITGPYKYNGKDTIIYDGYKALVSANQNAEKGSYILGYNLNFSADLTDYFSILSTLNFTYGRIKTDSTDYPLDHIPPVFGKTSFILKLDKFRSEFNVEYNGWKNLWDYNMLGEDNFGDATIYGMPSWYTLNLKAAYQFTKNLQLQVALDNILDKNYRVFASGFNSPGRNLSITLRCGL